MKINKQGLENYIKSIENKQAESEREKSIKINEIYENIQMLTQVITVFVKMLEQEEKHGSVFSLKKLAEELAENIGNDINNSYYHNKDINYFKNEIKITKEKLTEQEKNETENL